MSPAAALGSAARLILPGRQRPARPALRVVAGRPARQRLCSKDPSTSPISNSGPSCFVTVEPSWSDRSQTGRHRERWPVKRENWT